MPRMARWMRKLACSWRAFCTRRARKAATMRRLCWGRPLSMTSSRTNLPNWSRHTSSALWRTSDNTALALAPAQPLLPACCTKRRTARHPYLCFDAQTPLPASSSATKPTYSVGMTSNIFLTTWFAWGCCTASKTWLRNWPSNAAASNCTRQRCPATGSCSTRATMAMARWTARLEAPSRQQRVHAAWPSQPLFAAALASVMICKGSASAAPGRSAARRNLRPWLPEAAVISASCASANAAWSYSCGQESSSQPTSASAAGAQEPLSADPVMKLTLSS
mmetsp:Transcript_5848/g.16961  ORF Transcript_5848/g.16961 Transcript_5848/m.16961 type:complete len:278 (-) Transcript_5848:444-1277(-)